MNIVFSLFSEEELEQLHRLSLNILEQTGMRIDSTAMCDVLEINGAKVDSANQRVLFPRNLVEKTIEQLGRDRESGREAKYLNGVTSEQTDGNRIQAKFGGACIQYFDWQKLEYRDPSEEDLISMLKIGEALPEVATVGNPVVYLRDSSGDRIPAHMQRIMTAALVAKYTTKFGSTEVWNADELDLLLEIAAIAKDGMDAVIKDPCFITAKETISPLMLDRKSAEVMLALAERHLPVTIIPMPCSGISAPVSLAGTIAVGNAEILGVACAVKMVHPEARIVGGVISGSADMSNGSILFSSAEANLQDLGLAELHQRLYGLNFGVGGYTDAKYPGVQCAAEKQLKYLMHGLSGRMTSPVGLLNGGKCFSPEQALIDLQILKNNRRLLDGIALISEDAVLKSVASAGIGGSFLSEESTLMEYRKHLTVPDLFDTALSHGYEADVRNDTVIKAHNRVQEILSRDDMYEISADKAAAIDDVVRTAKGILLH